MTEPLGAISAVAGIATFLVQVGKGIKIVRRAIHYNRNQASDDLQALDIDLNSLHKVIDALSAFETDPLVALAIAGCQQSYNEMEPDLDRLAQIFGSDKSAKSRLKSFKRRTTLNAEDSVKELRTKIGQIVQALMQASIRITQLETIQPEQHNPAPPEIAEITSPPGPTQARGASLAGPPGLSNRVVAHSGRARMRVVERCYHKQTSYAYGRFWWLEITSTPGFWHNCSPRCPTTCEWNVKLRLALTWLNIPFAVTGYLRFASKNGQHELRPALSIQRVVRNTSPGFKALYLCKIDVLGLEESKQRLRDLCRSDEHFKYHVNPAGESYIRHLVTSPWQNQNRQFELLDFFVTELGMDFSSEDPGFLIRCSKWIGEGRHLYLLDSVLQHGFTPSSVDAPAADQWPEPCSPDWGGESYTPDPFFLEYFASILVYEPGFTGVTELQKSILTDTFHALQNSELLNRKEHISAVNFLGQSSLHLAVGNIRAVEKLVDLGHDLDVTDKWGTTPLMYAAAMGLEDVTVLLLTMEANPALRESRFGRTFLDFAIWRGHWSLVHKVLSTMQDLYPKELHHAFAQLVVFQAMTSRICDVVTREVRRKHIPSVIQHCDDVNFSFKDTRHSVTDNNLMHYAKSIEEAEALVSRGFDLFNKPNSAGRLPIHSMTSDTALVRFCVEHGININHADANGQTLLSVLLSRLGSFTPGERTTIRQIRCCLELGADPGHSDDCKCPCSPDGCSSSAFFANDFDSKWFTGKSPTTDIFWVFEWQSILQDFHGDVALKDFLLSFIRRIKFDELGMTHVCCHEGSGIPLECIAGFIGTYPKILDNEDLCDILEEEDEFIDILDQTMRELALNSVNELQRYLLEVLKERHDQHLQRNAEKRAKALWQNSTKLETSGVEWHVDYKKDELWQQIPSASSFLQGDYSVPGHLASYIVLLELEYSYIREPPVQRSEKDGWYSRRIHLIREITDVFGLSMANVVECIDDAVASARLDTDKNPVKRIKEHFVTVLKQEGQAMN